MQLFYKANFEQDAILDEIDSKHCIRVLRKKEGDEIMVTDGIGNLFTCQIADANQKKTKLNILATQREFEKPKRHIKVVIAPTKNIDRMEYFVEKAVEIGISEISFILTKNSERKHLKLDRLNRIAVSAMKQSLKAYLPDLTNLVTIKEYLGQAETAKQKFVAHLNEKSTDLTTNDIGDSVCIMVGPEGDFDPSEIEMAEAAGYEMVSMGHSRLRTETAGLVAVTLLNMI
ncbi:16S rRNA (uracil(1498)-N(3))-methyltransferase [Arcticibacterium luteifluviistationis]|uniref:Ribosomal RNA small subunit methyltransferase E n=1 Tax=Arcticibacterium luteifluviistationis TaxID=1784714 RepID=A0A2Z4G783_9BACT|nr:16S rRNA (uracil(1498)-N(3))-methyltransferase [Arcticibacterium luteifluviistationis]AWV97009.1 16S rRNA (uracil(1498)-N(3))-methyltransferase [Arcticibacterium luteifluviistationis]